MRREASILAIALAACFLLHDARAHDNPATFHWENEGIFNDGRSDIPIHWDVQTHDDPWRFGTYGSGRVEVGTSSAYATGCFDLYVEGVRFQGSTYSLDFDQRGLVTTERTVDDLAVVRKVYVPDSGLDFIRYVDTFTNDGMVGQPYTIEYRCWLGTRRVIAPEENFTSDGDAIYENTDTWVGSDIPGDTQPALAFVIQSEEAPVRVDRFPFDAGGDGQTYVSYELDLGPGETAALMFFGIQAQDEAAASAIAEAITELPDVATAWAEEDLDLVRNFVVAAPGAPIARTNGPYNVVEGGTVRLDATVEDLEGDPIDFAWDLDDDGVFDDAFVLDPEVSAVGVDGPSNLRVSLWASDGENEVVRRTTIRVQNVPPRILSDPPDSASTGERYQYQVVATDPAGEDDPFDYTVIGPPSMVVNRSGLVTWIPEERESYLSEWPVTLTVDDGDGGQVAQEWVVDLGGAPHVTVGEGYEVEEGGEVRVGITVFDSEDDPITIGWDLDRDGDFDDAHGLEAVYSAEGQDGPSTGFVRVSVTDGSWNVIARVNIEIVNAPPIFDSEPPREARVGATWEYTVVAHDPGGDDFDIEVEEDDLPPGMTYDRKTLSFAWPIAAAYLENSPYSFPITADDGDTRGRSRQDVTIAIIENFKPDPPIPIYPTPQSPSLVLRPTLKVGNGTDLDGDDLVYYFELDEDAGFRSLELEQSGPIVEGPGVTEWPVPHDLWPGTTYYWRVWVNDGIEDSDKMTTVFEVQVGTQDAGPDTGPDDGDGDVDSAGCMCRAAGTSQPIPTGLGLAVVGLSLLATRRRRGRARCRSTE